MPPKGVWYAPVSELVGGSAANTTWPSVHANGIGVAVSLRTLVAKFSNGGAATSGDGDGGGGADGGRIEGGGNGGVVMDRGDRSG